MNSIKYTYIIIFLNFLAYTCIGYVAYNHSIGTVIAYGVGSTLAASVFGGIFYAIFYYSFKKSRIAGNITITIISFLLISSQINLIHKRYVEDKNIHQLEIYVSKFRSSMKPEIDEHTTLRNLSYSKTDKTISIEFNAIDFTEDELIRLKPQLQSMSDNIFNKLPANFIALISNTNSSVYIIYYNNDIILNKALVFPKH
jgi:hypothetical protein